MNPRGVSFLRVGLVWNYPVEAKAILLFSCQILIRNTGSTVAMYNCGVHFSAG